MAARKLITRLFSSVSVSNKIGRGPKVVTGFPVNTKGVCFSSSSYTHGGDEERGLDRGFYRHEIGGTRIVLDSHWCELLIEHYIKKASTTNDDDVSTKAFNDALSLLLSMKKMSFQVTEAVYHPLMKFIVERKMRDKFDIVKQHFEMEHHVHLPRLSYYETLLSIRLRDEYHIQRLLDNARGSDEPVPFLEALAEEGRLNDVSIILSTFNILQVSSPNYMETLFKVLGKLQLESHAKSFILKLKGTNLPSHGLTNLICIYAMSLPMLQIQEIIDRFNYMRAELKVKSSSVKPFQKLIETCCDKRKVSLALKLADCMLADNLKLDIKTFELMLNVCDKNFDYDLVEPVYEMMLKHVELPSFEMFKMIVNIYSKMNKIQNAYDIIKALKAFGLFPDASMYNAIISAHFRMDEFEKAFSVLDKLDESKVKPDAHTFWLIIAHCSTEELINKYLQKCEEYGVPLTKQISFALVTAYVSCGLVYKAKEVLENQRIPSDDFKEIKSVLVSELAKKGHMSDAIAIYDEMRRDGKNLEPKTIVVLIQHGQNAFTLHQLLELLAQLEGHDLWVNGCNQIISYCVRHKFLSSSVDLLKRRLCKATGDLHIDVIFYGAFAEIGEMKPVDILFGMNLLRAMKEDLGIQPPRKCLDFLLNASANSKEGVALLWKMYELAGLPYNPFTYFRMHQALLAFGEHEQAESLVRNMPKYDATTDQYMGFLLEKNRSKFGYMGN